MALALETIVKQLEDSGIVAAGKLENFVPPKAHPQSVEELVAELVKQNHLTRFQAQHVAAGKTKSLILGGYTIIDKIGAGGMGQVFKATHRRMERVVAIKMLPAAMLKDAAAVARFQREVVAAAKLEHPNIVTAYDADQANGVHFLVMQYVDGKDLSALVKKDGPFSVAKAVNYVLQAAKGLEFAHGEGVIHRDIKPANLLLDKKGTVKILDMGLARIEQGDGPLQAELTGTGAIMGTVDYMAPEQGLSTKHADARADIYSLGCTLHFLLIGKPAYGGETVAGKLVAHHNNPIPNLSQLRDEVPEPVQAIFRKMVAKKIEDRYQTMTDVVADLEGCQSSSSSLSAARSVQATATDQESDLSIAFAHQRLRSLGEPPPEYIEPPKKPRRAKIAKTKTTKTKPALSRPKLSRPAWIGLVGAGVLGIGILLTVVLVKLRTQDGTLIVEVNQPDALVQVLDQEGKVEISQPGGLKPISISVVPGKHRLRVEKDGFVAIADNIQIESGGKLDIKARLVPKAKPGGLAGESSVSPAPLIAPFDHTQARTGQQAWARYLGTRVEQKNTVGMTLVLIPPGEFLMGSSPEQIAEAVKMAQDAGSPPTAPELARLNEESPQHKVAISKPFWIGSTEVTVGQFKKFVEATRYLTEAEQYGFGDSTSTKMDDTVTADQKKRNWRTPNQNYPVTDSSPVAQVTWNDAVQFCNWLSDQEKLQPCYRQDGKGGWVAWAPGTGYRLPTEAQWEYACRAGTTTQFSFGDDADRLEIYARYSKNAGSTDYVVGERAANPFGLFDMHGSLSEWCQDFYATDYYSKSSPNDPGGPPSSYIAHVARGGAYYLPAFYCRSALRSKEYLTKRHYYLGFRCMRVIDATQPETAVATAAKPTNLLSKPWNTPAFQQWVKATQALPAEKQIEAVSKKLMELNPGFDGKVVGANAKPTPRIENGVVTELGFLTLDIIDISPVRALAGLKALQCDGGGPGKGNLSDLSPLQGLPLRQLVFSYSKVADLSPLQGMPLNYLVCPASQVSDLSPLKGLPLLELTTNGSRGVSDLSPLKGMPLKSLSCQDSQVTDLSPIYSCTNLTSLSLIRTKVTLASVAALQKALPNCKIEWDDPAKAAAPAKLAYLDPAFQQWVKATQALLAEKQIEAVSKKLMELNPGFDGQLTAGDSTGTPKIVNGVVTGLWLNTDEVTDLSPLRALAGLKRLTCGRTQHSKLADLSPLRGLSLEQFTCAHNNVSDLSPLEGMPLTELGFSGTKVADLSPIRGMPLTYLNFQVSPVADLSPVRGMRLTILNCGGSNVSDLSPIAGMPLVTLITVKPQRITKGIEGLRRMISLRTIGFDGNNMWPVAEFWKKYDAGEFGKLAPSAKLAYLDPAFQQWVKTTQALPAEQQIEAVSKKLMELNPGFDGKLTNYDGKGSPMTPNGVVTTLGFATKNVSDISPVRALPGLYDLNCSGSGADKGKLSDLSPLAGMKLAYLACSTTQVSDLTPLKGMPLTTLWCNSTQVSDLSPLHGMKLTGLFCGATPVSDLSPLKGMPLTALACDLTPVSDLSPLQDCKNLAELSFTPKNITKGLDVIRQMKSLKNIGISRAQKDMPPPAEFWKKYDAGEFGKPAATKLAYLDPAFQAWVADTQKLPAEKQIEAISTKLMELNPGFDGKMIGPSFGGGGTPKVQTGVVTEIGFFTENVTDISPVRALTGLKALGCTGGGSRQGKLSDLSPLNGMPLTFLVCYNTKVSDLSPLKQAKLTYLHCGRTQVSDLSPLQGMPLTYLACSHTTISDLAPLKGMPLTFLSCTETLVSDLSPLRGMPLANVHLSYTKVVDLSPLQGMPLTDLRGDHTQVIDLSPLADCTSMKTLDINATNVTPASVATLQKALPDCKIDWDDPAKPKSP